MTVTATQIQTDLPRLLDLVERGEEVVITVEGQPKARLTRTEPECSTLPTMDRDQWLAKLAKLRERLSTGKMTPSAEDLVDEDRQERS